MIFYNFWNKIPNHNFVSIMQSVVNEGMILDKSQNVFL